MAEIGDLVVNDVNNTGRWTEGFSAPDVNNAGRALEGILARWFKDMNGTIASSGSTNAYAILTNRATPSLVSGLRFVWTATLANTSSATLTVNALSAKPLVQQGGGALTTGLISANQIVDSVYNSSTDKWHCMGVGS